VPEIRLHFNGGRGRAGRIDRIGIPLDSLVTLDVGLGDAMVSVLRVSVGVKPDLSNDRAHGARRTDHLRRGV